MSDKEKMQLICDTHFDRMKEWEAQFAKNVIKYSEESEKVRLPLPKHLALITYEGFCIALPIILAKMWGLI